MLNTEVNPTQATLGKIINKKLSAAAQRIKRIIFAEDADGNPAELYGADGKVYYRAGGKAAVEIGGASGWVLEGTDTKLADTTTGADLNGKPLKASGDNDLTLQVPVGKSIIIKKV